MTSYTRRSHAHGSLVVSYGQELSSEHTDEVCTILARHHLDFLTEAGWCAGGIYIADCLSSGDLPPLCDYDPDVLDLCPADRYHLEQALAFFRKRGDIDLGVDREAAALAKFREAEESCRVTNQCFRAWAQGRFQFRPCVEAVLHTARRKIAQVLGTAPSPRNIRPRLGPGASTQVPKRNACLALKLEHTPACSTNLAGVLDRYVSNIHVAEGAPEEEVEFAVHHSRVAFVPKTAKIDRAICVEPQLNSMFQLGLGDHMARRLRRVGIDIRDQSHNQRLARYGSTSGYFGTIDLSSASDTVALGLCQHLLPEDWYELICDLRSATCLVAGEVITLEKVSSMGNGFTFPLETLVFWAIAQSVSDTCSQKWRVVKVYGDDIIAPSEACSEICDVLQALGFTPNWKKSFWEGGFRESCGADYLFGTSVRPVFVKGQLLGADFFRLHNFYQKRGDRWACAWLSNAIHPSIRLHGPEGFGDGHLHSRAYRTKREGVHKGWSGFSFETWAFRPKVLKRSILLKYATPVKGGVTWREHCFALVRRIATYCAMGIVRREPWDPDYLVRGSDPFTVPGTGTVT